MIGNKVGRIISFFY